MPVSSAHTHTFSRNLFQSLQAKVICPRSLSEGLSLISAAQSQNDALQTLQHLTLGDLLGAQVPWIHRQLILHGPAAPDPDIMKFFPGWSYQTKPVWELTIKLHADIKPVSWEQNHNWVYSTCKRIGFTHQDPQTLETFAWNQGGTEVPTITSSPRILHHQHTAQWDLPNLIPIQLQHHIQCRFLQPEIPYHIGILALPHQVCPEIVWNQEYVPGK